MNPRILTVAAASTLGVLIWSATPSLASAETVAGRTGPTSIHERVVYLHNSSVSNDSGIVARSKIWSTSGQDVAPNKIAAAPRLFKSGALCQAVGYTFNSSWAPSQEVATSANCGSGSYNSHGFVKVHTANSGVFEYPTFPSNPINYTGSPSARATVAASAKIPDGISTVNGKTFGPHDNSKSSPNEPDFVAAFTDDGRLGYVASSRINKGLPSGVRLPIVSESGEQIGALTVR